MNESYYTTKILRPRFQELRCKFKKHHQGQFSKGWPDVEVRGYRNTVVMNIEIKVDDRKVTKLQKEELLDICKYGGYSFVIRKQHGKEYILGLDEKSRDIAVYLGLEFERLAPGKKFVYSFDHSTELQDQYKRIMEG
jgi:hypothetical protein